MFITEYHNGYIASNGSFEHASCFERRIRMCVVFRAMRSNVVRVYNVSFECVQCFERTIRMFILFAVRLSIVSNVWNATCEALCSVERRVLAIGNLRVSCSTVNTASPRVSNATVTTRCSRKCSSAMFETCCCPLLRVDGPFSTLRGLYRCPNAAFECVHHFARTRLCFQQIFYMCVHCGFCVILL